MPHPSQSTPIQPQSTQRCRRCQNLLPTELFLRDNKSYKTCGPCLEEERDDYQERKKRKTAASTPIVTVNTQQVTPIPIATVNTQQARSSTPNRYSAWTSTASTPAPSNLLTGSSSRPTLSSDPGAWDSHDAWKSLFPDDTAWKSVFPDDTNVPSPTSFLQSSLSALQASSVFVKVYMY